MDFWPGREKVACNGWYSGEGGYPEHASRSDSVGVTERCAAGPKSGEGHQYDYANSNHIKDISLG